MLARPKDKSRAVLYAPGDRIYKKDFEESDWKVFVEKGYIFQQVHETLDPKETKLSPVKDSAKVKDSIPESKLREKTLDELNTLAVERGRPASKLFEDSETAISWLSAKAPKI